MSKYELYYTEVLPTNSESAIFEQRESGVFHTPYETETIFYSYIRQGDINKVKSALKSFLANGVVVGRLSKDNLRQMQYLAVCCITLAVRYAIQGGVDETDAYNLSDTYIRKVDEFTMPDKIIDLLMDIFLELTAKVYDSLDKQSYPCAVTKCIHYINKNLHNKITVTDLANECGLTPDYLSALFKKHTHTNISAYIMKCKLEASKALLNGKYNYSSIGYYLSFASESHFINRFKKEYGITPRQYANSLKY